MVKKIKISFKLFKDKLFKSYTISIILIISLLSIFQIIIQIKLNGKKDYAKVINLAGRQRMLSQRLAKFVYQCQFTNCQNQIENSKKDLENFYSNHFKLMNGSNELPKAFNDQIFEKYKSLTTYLEQINDDVECIIQNCKRLINVEEFNINSDQFLEIMDQIVFDSQKFEELQEEKIRIIEIVLFLITLLVILYEILVIFIPMNRKLLNDYEELKAKDMQLLHQAKLVSLGTLISSIIHEIKNPLSIIIGFQKVLKLKLEGEKDLSEILNKQEIATDRINKIIESMRITSRKGESEQRIIFLDQLIENNIELLSPIFAHKNVTFIFNKNEKIKIKTDPELLSQIFVNLISNASDAMIKSDIKKIEFSYLTSGHDVLLSISDTGTGIPIEIQDKIFDEFFTTKDKETGTGLGLNIVKKTLERMNSSICISHTNENGTTFLITLRDCVL